MSKILDEKWMFKAGLEYTHLMTLACEALGSLTDITYDVISEMDLPEEWDFVGIRTSPIYDPRIMFMIARVPKEEELEEVMQHIESTLYDLAFTKPIVREDVDVRSFSEKETEIVHDVCSTELSANYDDASRRKAFPDLPSLRVFVVEKMFETALFHVDIERIAKVLNYGYEFNYAEPSDDDEEAA